MDQDRRYSKFIDAVIFLVKIFEGLEDRFMAEKLYTKLNSFMVDYINFFQFWDGEQRVGVAQYSKLKEVVNSIEGTLDLLDYLEHAKLLQDTPLLYSRRNLLNVKLELLSFYPKSDHHSDSQKEETVGDVVATTAETSKVISKSLRENSNKEKIFNFIKRSSAARTKDIIEEFSILSQRTVKRNLKELIQDGLLAKQVKSNAVYYSTK